MSSAPELIEQFRPTYVEIDVDAFGRNVEAMQRRLGDTRLVAVVKADAYGHGAIELARRAARSNVPMIAVALLEEALELRTSGIEIPILVLGPMKEEQLRAARENDLRVGVVGPEELAAIAAIGADDFPIHLKLDSGMGRMGVTRGELPDVIRLLRQNPGIRVEAIYTHFANASDPADSFTQIQLDNFREMLDALRSAGIDAPLHHSANSAAAVRGLISPGDYARVGIALYGAEPLDSGGFRLEPVMRWRTEIARLKTLPPGHGIGYGTTFTTKRESRIATLPVGYADGYSRALSNLADVLVRGRRAPIAGRVAMDLITIDVTDVAGAAVGDEVVLLGSQGSEAITADDLASRIGTISYEVFCRVSARVPRVYRADGRMSIRSKFLEHFNLSSRSQG